MDWRVAAACAIGTSHVVNGMPCQDSLRVEIVETGEGQVLIAVVSDGAGSASQADAGSAIVVSQSAWLARRFLANGGTLYSISRDTVQDWLAVIQSTIDAGAQLFGHKPREYAATWLLAIVGTRRSVFAQIGDGAIVVANENGT